MNKKITLYLSLSTIVVMLIFPVLINFVLVFPLFSGTIDKTGDYPVWVPTLATFWGAVIGGVMAGFLTIYSVNKTIQSSFHALEISNEQQWNLHEREIEIANAKERLKEFYHPAKTLAYKFYMTHGAYSFEDLSSEEQSEYILLLREKSLYADRALALESAALQEAHRAVNDKEWHKHRYFQHLDKDAIEERNAEDVKRMNMYFNNVSDYISETSKELRKKVGLPD